MNLPFVMGTELTGIHASYDEATSVATHRNLDFDWFEFESRREASLKNVRNDLRLAGLKIHGIHYDDHCLEISSKKISDFASLKNFCIKTRKIMQNNLFFPKNPTTVCGGAHVHVGIKDMKIKYEIARDLVMRPYLPWVFGEPDEAGAMDVLINKKEEFEDYAIRVASNQPCYGSYSARFLSALMLPFNPETNYNDLSDSIGKETMFRLSEGYNTLEIRFMEMTETWEEHELQLNFISHYIDWMLMRILTNRTTHIKLITNREMQKIEPKVCADLFNELCYDIGLNPDDYAPFIKRNLYPRWQDGRKRR